MTAAAMWKRQLEQRILETMKNRVKHIRSAVWWLLFGLLALGVQAQNNPLWQNAPTGANLSNLATPPRAQDPIVVPRTASIRLASVSSQSVPEAIDPELVALATSLGDGQKVTGESQEAKALRIYNWVRNNIGYTHYHGLKKGALLTFLEGSGNDFDQCALLRDLLVAAGYEATSVKFFVMPCMVDYSVLCEWLGFAEEPFPGKTFQEAFPGVSNIYAPYGASPKASKQLQFARNSLMTWGSADRLAGFTWPGWTADGLPDRATVLFDRMFVGITFNEGREYQYLDPSLKSYRKGLVLNLGSASGYSRSAMLTAAGGTGDGNSVFGMNATTTQTYLNARAGAILSAVGSGQGMVDIVGGRSLVPFQAQTLQDAVRRDKLYADEREQLETTNDPLFAKYKPKVRFSSVAAAGLNLEMPTADLRGSKLTLTFNGSIAELRLDDDKVVASGALGAATKMDLTIAVTHPGPYGSQFENKTYSKQTGAGGACSYAIVYGFDAAGRLLAKRQEKLKAYLDAKKLDSSREVRTEILNIMGLAWHQQTDFSEKLLAAQNAVIPIRLHSFGRVAQEEGFYIDVGLRYSLHLPNDGEWLNGRYDNVFQLGNLFASAMEHGIIEQTQSGSSAVSTVNILRKANSTSSNSLLLAKASNWNAISPMLTAGGYSQAQVAQFNTLIGQGAQLFLPKNFSVIQGNWKGSGWVIRQPDRAGMIINGGYSGGYATSKADVQSSTITKSSAANPASSVSSSSSPVNLPSPSSGAPKYYAADPVDMASGAFVLAAEDMATGIEGAPRGLAFARNYSSNMASRDEQNLGYGWMHNFHIRAVARTASDEALGMGSPQQAAAFLAAVTAASDLYRKDATPKEWGVAALAVGWFVDQMKDNAVSVRMGKDIFQFIKQPDGSFTAPPGSTMILTKATDGTYRLQQRLGNTIEFDAAGKATRIVDVDGRAMTFNYNANGTINFVEDAVGRRYTFGYSGTHITSVTDSTSPTRSVTFGYDTTNWNLTSATDPEGKVSYFDYSVAGDPGGTTAGQHRIVRLRNHDGETITQNVWDSLGRVERQFLHGDTNKTFRLYYTGRENGEVNPQGGITRYFYDERGRAAGSRDPEGNANSMTYDGQDRVVTRTTGANETTAYTYDAAHNLTRIDHPRGGGSTLMAYDNLNRLDLVTDPNGAQTDYVYFGSGADAAKDRPQSVIAAKGTAEQSITTYTYMTSGAAIGRVATITDADGLVTSKTYDALGQPDVTTLPGGFRLNEDYSARGNLDAITDANLKKTSYSYNKRRQRTGEVADTGGVAATSNSTFDNQARVATLTPPVDNEGKCPQQSFTYNPTDKVRHKMLNNVMVEETGYDSRDWASTAKDAANRTTIFVRKANGDLAETQRPSARTTKFFYDGDNRVTATQAPGANSGPRNEAFVYDTTSSGRPRTVKTEADGCTVTSEYDAAGRLRFVTDRKGAKFEFRYDALGRRTHVITPTGATTTTAYTKNGRAASVLEPSGDKTTFTYSATTGRLASAVHAGAGGATVNYTGYDANGNLLSLNEGGNGTITRTYDGLNRVTSYMEAGKTIGYRYYPSGKLAKVIYPGGTETGVGHIEYTYNADGRLYQVIDRLSSTTSPRTTTYVWNTDGRLATVTRPNGTVRTISYDAAGRPSGISDAGIVWGIGYYASDEIATLDVSPAVPAQRLAPVPAAQMTFDAANRLATFNGQTVPHDADGNSLRTTLPEGGWVDLTYDSRNRLTGAGGFAYRYNAEGNRVGLTSANETTTLTVDPQGALPKVLESVKNGVRTRYVYGAGLQYEVNDAGSATYYHYDQSGNTAALTNQAGAIIERVVYSPYGTIRYRQSNYDTPFLYGGFFGVMTDANGLINMRARYYNPLTMRFLNSDPAMDGLNWYAYANGNPINFADPTGYGAQKVLGDMNKGSNWSGVGSNSWLNALGMVGSAITTGIKNYNNMAATVWTAVVGNVASGFNANAVNRLQQANHHYRNGGRAAVTVDSGSLNFSGLKTVTPDKPGYTFPASSVGDFLVHGSVGLTPQGNGNNLKITDRYDFDIDPKRDFKRNVATAISHFAADPLDFYTNPLGNDKWGWAYWSGSGGYDFTFSPATIPNPR
jgi:RHS repeat-associated protein